MQCLSDIVNGGDNIQMNRAQNQQHRPGKERGKCTLKH